MNTADWGGWKAEEEEDAVEQKISQQPPGLNHRAEAEQWEDTWKHNQVGFYQRNIQFYTNKHVINSDFNQQCQIIEYITIIKYR